MLCRRLVVNFLRVEVFGERANLMKVSKFEQTRIREKVHQDPANEFPRGSLTHYCFSYRNFSHNLFN